MTPLNLDLKTRDILVQKITTALERAVAGSMVLLRGSLAAGTADAFSDIDLLWEVPDAAFVTAVERIAAARAQAQPVESLRSAPDFQNSDRRRLFFVQFVDMPLFWRADIDVFARSIHLDTQYDLDNQAARGGNWSLTHSALMNAIAAIKALLRGKDEVAQGLLERGFARLGLAVPDGDLQALILKLAESAVALDPVQAALAGRIRALHQQVFSEGEGE